MTDRLQPYVGPRPFGRQDQDLFFGRDAEVNHLFYLVIANQIVVLHGQSGAGKTSIIHAGLIPRLEKEFEVFPVARVRRPIPENMRLDEKPNPFVLSTLKSWASEIPPGQLAQQSLADFIAGREPLVDDMKEPLPRVIILDQFEELFAADPEQEEDRRAFLRQISDAIEGRRGVPPLRAIFVVRDDAVVLLDQYASLLPARLRTRFRLEPLDKEAALEAVEGPLKDKSPRFAPGVAGSLVQELLRIRTTGSETPETAEGPQKLVEPLQLQIACSIMWADLPPDTKAIGQEHLPHLGDVDQTLTAFYERAVQWAALKAKTEEGDVRNWCERQLITPQGSRATVQRQETVTDIPTLAIEELVQQRLIRAVLQDGVQWYELVHDRFVETTQKSNERWRAERIPARQKTGQLGDVVINLQSPAPNVVRTAFYSQNVPIIEAQTELPPETKARFMDSLNQYISHCLDPLRYPEPGLFYSPADVGDYILHRFTTDAIKDYLQYPTERTTILLEVDEALKDIPWELMLETTYVGDIPFQVGRRMLGLSRPKRPHPPVCGDVKIRALLVGDPTGDLPAARAQVIELADTLHRDARFEVDVLTGSKECSRVRLLEMLASGRYGLVHYTGRTQLIRYPDGFSSQSAWQLQDGTLTDDMLTNALEPAPPAFVFNASVQSAGAGDVVPLEYQDQALPNAFLRAGVDAYVGTLWNVHDRASSSFVEEFYDAFLGGELNLGECLRHAKRSTRRRAENVNAINWLAFILYGDPYREPGALFPALRPDRGAKPSKAERTVLEPQAEFSFGTTKVQILQGDILKPGVEVDAVASSDDNYLTMSAGISRLLSSQAGARYVRAAQKQCPVKAGMVIVTKAYSLPRHGLNVEYVLHGAVIDLDTDELPLEQVVYQVTANCLEKAEELGLHNILLPAFATGAGGFAMETCARQMCSAIKAYLARDRPLETVYIMLHSPQASEDARGTAWTSKQRARNLAFIREANLVLGLPYDPALSIRQVRDFYGCEDVLERLEAVITGALPNRRHALVTGGPRIGKSILLDQLLHRAQLPGSAMSQGRRLARVAFGRVNENTPAAFFCRKLLLALSNSEPDEAIRHEIVEASADPEVNRARFLEFLEAHADRYPEVIFVVDDLHRLLMVEASDSPDAGRIKAFWGDANTVDERVRFVFAAESGSLYRKLQGRAQRLNEHFAGGVEIIELTCVTDEERREWISELYSRYLGRDATPFEHDLLAEEAGRHPYLVRLALRALIEILKRDALTSPTTRSDRSALMPLLQAARSAMQEPREEFFELLVGDCLGLQDRVELYNLARAVAIEQAKQELMPALWGKEPDAAARFEALMKKGNPRQFLNREPLRELEARGYLVDADDPSTVQFMAKSFADWVIEYFGVGQSRDASAR